MCSVPRNTGGTYFNGLMVRRAFGMSLLPPTTYLVHNGALQPWHRDEISSTGFRVTRLLLVHRYRTISNVSVVLGH